MNHLGDNEVEPLLCEFGVEVRVFGERAQARDLAHLAVGVARGHAVLGLQFADLLRATKPLGEHVNERGVDVIDAAAQREQRSLWRSIAHSASPIPV